MIFTQLSSPAFPFFLPQFTCETAVICVRSQNITTQQSTLKRKHRSTGLLSSPFHNPLVECQIASRRIGPRLMHG
jgi:hypothetical protein